MKACKFRSLALLLLFSLLLSACSSPLSELELPPLPTPTEEPSPTPVPTYVPKLSPTPAPTEAEASPSPLPLALPTPVPTPTAVPGAPLITAENITLPEDMLENNISSLLGWIYTDSGFISEVYASITDASGETVQDCLFHSDQASFSLAGTVNAELQFARLTPGGYTYLLTATAVNAVTSVTETLAEQPFTVYAQADAQELYSGLAEYTAKHSDASDNEAQIWNFFIDELGTPYGAAAVLANIKMESLCSPERVYGDLSEDCRFSKDYTGQVDSGAISREAFAYELPAEGYGLSYGLCQWTGDRKATLYDFAAEYEGSVGDLKVQCEYIMFELTYLYPSLLEILKNTSDYASATREFCYTYEQAAVPGNRTLIARELLDRYAR